MTGLKPNEAPEPLWESVGHALSYWESAEMQLAVLWCIFSDRPGFTPNLASYGNEGTVFSARIQKLERAAETYFIREPDQAFEGRFRAVVTLANDLGIYRHRVAHGVVSRRNISGWWWLMPPWYTEKLHYEGEPYFYCSAQVDAIAEHFATLRNRAKALLASLP
jgi:hypothetical protein